MDSSQKLAYLRIALVAVGAIFVAGILPLMIVWPAGAAATPVTARA